jgi:hypothetical protein
MMSSERSLLVMCLYFNVLTWFLVVLIFQLMGLDSVGARTASFGLGQAWRKRRQRRRTASHGVLAFGWFMSIDMRVDVLEALEHVSPVVYCYTLGSEIGAIDTHIEPSRKGSAMHTFTIIPALCLSCRLSCDAVYRAV